MGTPSHSTYHALQVSASKNSPRLGLGFQSGYTFSKSLDDTSAIVLSFTGPSGTVLQTLPQNPWNPGADKGPSTFDMAQAFSTSIIQMLPLERVDFLRPLGKKAPLGLASPQHYDPHHRLAVLGLFRHSTDRRGLGGGRPARSDRGSGFLHPPHGSGGLLRPGRQQRLLLFHPH